MCWLSVNSTQELFGKYPNHLGSTVARWPPLQEIPLLARKFHTALTLLRKERRKEGGNVAVCSVFMEYLWEFGLNVQIYVGLSSMHDKISPILLTDSSLS